MRALTLLSCIALSACGTLGSLNGSSGSIGSLGFGAQPVQTTQAGTPVRALTPTVKAAEADPRTLSARITQAELTPTGQGALLRVTATPNAPGSFNAELVKIGQSGGVLVLALRMQATADTNTQPRQITLARALPHSALRGIREIHIRAAGGTTVLRR